MACKSCGQPSEIDGYHQPCKCASPDLRDATIARLERELAEARERLAGAISYLMPDGSRVGVLVSDDFRRTGEWVAFRSNAPDSGLKDGAGRVLKFASPDEAFNALAGGSEGTPGLEGEEIEHGLIPLATAKEPGNGTL